MGRILGGAVVPSAPVVVPAVAPRIPDAHAEEVRRLREAARDAVEGLPSADAVVLIANGRRGVHARAHVDLGPLGYPELTRQHPVPRRLLPDITSRTQYAQRPGDDLDVDLAVLALQLPEDTPVIPIAVAPADGASLAGTGRAVADALLSGDLDVVLLCAGDLSTALHEGSPRYHAPGAEAWDAATVAALREDDLGALTRQGAGAARVHARSWAPLVVTMAAARAAGLHGHGLAYHVVRGVGHVVGRLRP